MIILSVTLLLGAVSAAPLRPDPAFQWNSKRWEIRYIVFIEPLRNFTVDTDTAIQLNSKTAADHKSRKSLDGSVLLHPGYTFAVDGMEQLGVADIRLDNKGDVTGPNPLVGYFGRRTAIDNIVLIPKRAPNLQYTIALWSQGVPGDIYFSPAVCDIIDVNHRYGESWIHGFPRFGDVGCREWTAQLYDRDRPYIDITTYTDDGNFIGSLVGWSRFRDPPKPVIGQHGAAWLCLYECPAGERPGVIPDIRAWTARHGFPLPHRPKAQPEFPNRNYRDDFNE